MSTASSTSAPTVTLNFTQRVVESDAAIAILPPESQAALRQFSLERTIGYGVDYADAIELRARVLNGEGWQSAASDLALTCLNRIACAPPTAGAPTCGAYLRRAAALLRMSQMMMLTDSAVRCEIFSRAVDLYNQAAGLLHDRRPVTIESTSGKLAGWLVPASGQAQASVIVIGGIEGWGMDFDGMGVALADRGVDVLLLDGPGQGASRLIYGHYLSEHWRDAYTAAVDWLEQRAPGRPIGIVGNSMGGSFAMAVAASDIRIRACCCNGGIIAPAMVPPQGTFFSKMVTFCGAEALAAQAIWQTVLPVAAGANGTYPLLIVHGGKDPMVSMEMSELLLAQAPTSDKQMLVFSDGDHCIYNHQRDRDTMIADWVCSRLQGNSHFVLLNTAAE